MRVLLSSATALLLIALPLAADPVVDRTVDGLILPRMQTFAEASARLAATAEADCLATSADLRAAWHAAFDAWIAASPFRPGPVDVAGRGLAIAFWPDSKGSTPRALARLIANDDPILADRERFGKSSVASRGLFALEQMLFDPQFNSYGAEDPGCRLTRAAAANLADMAQAIATEWQDDFAALVKTAGQAGNSQFLSEREARQMLFTALLSGLQFDEEQRLARPLGSDDRPRPGRAEARAAGRSLHNIRVSLAELESLAQSLTDGGTQTVFERFTEARALAAALDDPIFDGVESPEGRARITALMAAIHHTREAVLKELGPELGVSAGFNSLDGD